MFLQIWNSIPYLQNKIYSQFSSGVIIDEAQRYPDLFSYIQTVSDEVNESGKFILTGSQNFLLSEKISQSLAGRVFITHLLPFSISELRHSGQEMDSPDTYMFQGFYPRMYDARIHSALFYPSYTQTYVERDVRQIVNVGNLHQFQRFMRLAACSLLLPKAKPHDRTLSRVRWINKRKPAQRQSHRLE